MNHMNKFCLNWNGYDANIREHFKKFREDQKMSDVTLVSDDGQHIRAHKIILTAGSDFFSDIFMKSNHSNMLVYLKGISSDKLEPVIDFIYNGEVFITQEQMKVFIETGKDLQVKGLEGELTGVEENENKMLTNPQENKQRHEEDCEDVKVFISSPEVSKMNEEISQARNNELSLQVNEMIEKIDGVWRCKICGRTPARNTMSETRRHAERHIEGMSHACHICSKIFPHRHSLSCHISNVHSELICCDICGKTGMNRKAYRDHKRKNHN